MVITFAFYGFRLVRRFGLDSAIGASSSAGSFGFLVVHSTDVDISG